MLPSLRMPMIRSATASGSRVSGSGWVRVSVVVVMVSPLVGGGALDARSASRLAASGGHPISWGDVG